MKHAAFPTERSRGTTANYGRTTIPPYLLWQIIITRATGAFPKLIQFVAYVLLHPNTFFVGSNYLPSTRETLLVGTNDSQKSSNWMRWREELVFYATNKISNTKKKREFVVGGREASVHKHYR